MDTTKGDLSFVVSGVNYGIAFDGIPLDKPLVPCVILGWIGDSVELNTKKVKENINKEIAAPRNFLVINKTWDSLTFSWDPVFRAQLYHIEVDGTTYSIDATERWFIKEKLFSQTEYKCRIRVVKDNEVGEWSKYITGTTLKAPSFSECIWKECSSDINSAIRYSVDVLDPTVVSVDEERQTFGQRTVIGNTPLPHNKVTSWSIKILKSKDNNGSYMFVGVAPFDINQNEGENYKKCGWYLNFYTFQLYSGASYTYKRKKYGPRKGNGEYVHTRDSVGVVMDTTKGELSFVVNGVSFGVAFEGIPLDKPLVPCVLLRNKGDSVKLNTSGVLENVSSSIFAPLRIEATDATWDSITLSWDAVEGASFYQIKVNGSGYLDSWTGNTFTKRDLLPDTEYSFRMRAVCGNKASA